MNTQHQTFEQMYSCQKKILAGQLQQPSTNFIKDNEIQKQFYKKTIKYFNQIKVCCKKLQYIVIVKLISPKIMHAKHGTQSNY